MSSMKTSIAGFLLCLTLSSEAADGPELTDIVATCVGRMSAEMEFAWLLHDAEADHFENQRERFVEILESLGPPPNPKRQLAARIDAKMAHARLLTTAHFGTDKTRADWSKRQAVMMRSACQNMLLES
ncbi:MAG: hypothetical protein AAF280_12460 [Pseudomonadota bacterium]